MKRVQCLMMAALALTLSAFAADTTYTWTGTAGDGKWSTPNNWDKGSGYPSAASHIAQFAKSATVTVDTGAQVTIGYIKVTAGNVTLNGSAGSYLTLDHAVAVGGDGFVVQPGCTLTMNVPMVSTKRVDKWSNGTVVFGAAYTNTATSFPLLMSQGTNIVAAGGSIYLPNDILNIANGDGDANGYTTLLVQGDAQIYTKGIAVSIAANSRNAGRVVQDGAASRVEAVAGNLEIGKAQKAGTPASSYTLKNGALSVGGDIYLGQSGTASLFRQEGGKSSLKSFIVTNSSGRVELAGGELYTDKAGMVTRVGATSTFAFSGGTYKTSTSLDDHFGFTALELSGTPTLQVGQRFFFPTNTTIADGTVLTVYSTSGSGGAYIDTGVEQEVAGELVVTNGNFNLNSGSLVPKLNATTPWKLTVKDGGTLFMRRIDSRLAVPVDLALSGTGKIQMANNDNGSGFYNRSVIIAHSFTRDGVAQAKGRYSAAADSAWFKGLPASSIVVCYVWTGAGDGTSWNDPANWDGNAVPPSDYNTCVDLSRAAGGTITLNGSISLGFIGFLPSGMERSLTITGDCAITHDGPDWSCGFFIREGCDLVLDRLTRVNRPNNNTKRLSILGGGCLHIGSTFPGLNKENKPSYTIDGEVIYENHLYVFQGGDYKQIGYYTHEREGHSKIVFSKNSVSTSSDNILRISLSSLDFCASDEFVQDGADLVMKQLFITRHNYLARSPFAYTLNSGSLTLEYCALGTMLAGSWQRYSDGAFIQNGGTLTLNEFKSECNNNHVYLKGGDVYLKTSFTRTGTGGNETCLHLGGARIHATGNWTCALGVDLSGVNGDVTIDTAGYNNAINHNVSGKGGLIKEGAGTLTLAKTNTFTGSLVVNGGIVTMPAGSRMDGPTEIIVNSGSVNLLGEIATAPDSITVPDSSCLTIGSDITVKRYVVDGVPQADGTYTVSGHTLTVASGLATVWRGASGGNWTVAGNWTGDVPNGATAVADFGASPTLGGGGSVVLDANVTLKTLAFANNITNTALTISGASTLTMATSGNDIPNAGEIFVGSGQTLVIESPLGMTAGYVLKKGSGRLVLNGAVSGLSNDAGYYFVVLEGEMEVNGTVRNCRLWVSNNDGIHEPRIIIGEHADIGSYASVHPAWKVDVNMSGDHGHAVQNGGVVDCNPPAYGFAGRIFAFSHFSGGTGSYTLNAGTLNLYRGYNNFLIEYGNGTFNFLQNGGTFNACRLYLAQEGANDTTSSYTLNGGTLVLSTRLIAQGSGKTHVALNGGTVCSATSPVLFDSVIPVSLGGEVTFTQSVAAAALVVSNTIEGDGAIRQQGPGSLTFAGRNYFTGAAAVDGGTLGFDSATRVTNFTATAGTFKFGAGALPLMQNSVIDMGEAGSLNLDFTGEAVVKELWANGLQRQAGVYSATSGHLISSRISGTGTLVVLEGKAISTMIIFR